MFLYANLISVWNLILFCFDFLYTGSTGDAYVIGGDEYGHGKAVDAYGTDSKAADGHAKDDHFFFNLFLLFNNNSIGSCSYPCTLLNEKKKLHLYSHTTLIHLFTWPADVP